MTFAIGVDIGGTKIAFALVDESGQVLADYRLPTLPEEGADAVVGRVAQGITALMAQADKPVAGVGIGCPGNLNPDTGIVHSATNLGWRDVPLLDSVRGCVKLPLWLEKDANASALGEMYFGAARGCRDFVLLALGTGLGGGAVVGGEVVRGGHFRAMEIGHMPFNPNGRLCVCGMHGCPEIYTSGVGLLAAAREYLPDYPSSMLASVSEMTTAAILDAAHAGDELASRIMDEAVEWICSVMICCMGILDPALFVVGGGLGHAGREWYIDRARERLRKRVVKHLYPDIQIVESQVNHSAVGAACLVWHGLQQREKHLREL